MLGGGGVVASIQPSSPASQRQFAPHLLGERWRVYNALSWRTDMPLKTLEKQIEILRAVAKRIQTVAANPNIDPISSENLGVAVDTIKLSSTYVEVVIDLIKHRRGLKARAVGA